MNKPRSRRGGDRPTIADVARRAGVGAITVSRALREPGRVSDELRRQIQAAVDELGYVPDLNARALASARAEAFGGVLLAGYASKAAQSMGDAYLLPSIAAVVLGGTSILGGRGSYLGTVAGVILITLLQSILSVMQMPEAGRQIIYGVVIVAMLLLYGRAPASR